MSHICAFSLNLSLSVHDFFGVFVYSLTLRATGLPVAYFLFTAPPGAKRGNANYDTNILAGFLEKWRDCVPPPKGQEGAVFFPKVYAMNGNMSHWLYRLSN